MKLSIRIFTLSLVALVAVSAFAQVPSSTTISNGLGFQADLPAGWQVVRTSGTFQVLQRPGQTANELYLLGGDAAGKAAASWDASFQKQDDELMAQLGTWKRKGDVLSFKTDGPLGMLAKYSGSLDGVTMEAQLWSVVSGGKRFGLMAIVPESMADTIYPSLFSLAASLRTAVSAPGAGAPVTGDAKEWIRALSGKRLVQSKTGNSDSLNGSAGTNVDRSVTLFADGTFLAVTRSTAFVSAGEFSSISDSTDEDRGRWTVEIQGGKPMLVVTPEGKPKLAIPLEIRGEFLLLNGVAFTVGQ
mgnify:FL=1